MQPVARRTARFAALLLALAFAVRADADPEVCARDFTDPDTGEPTTLELLVSGPADGLELDRAVFEPECATTVTVTGLASTIGIPPQVDFYVVLDTSGSTSDSSGVDVDGDGWIDSIFAAEIAAARSFVDSVDLAAARVSLFSFAGSVETLAPLGADRQQLLLALAQLRARGSGGQTNFGLAMSRVVQHRASAGDATRQGVVLFLSDGEPSDPGPPPPPAGLDPCDPWSGPTTAGCSGILWAQHAALAWGLRVETFAVGLDASRLVLEEMAARGGGRLTEVARAGDVATVLASVNQVGVAEVRVRCLDTADEVVADLTPDGSFVARVRVLPGENDLIITAVADRDPSWNVSCSRRVTLTCASYECPDSARRECEGGGATVASLRPWTSHAAIRVTSSHDADGNGDAGGWYPLGVTEVDFTLTDVEGHERACTADVAVTDAQAPWLEGVPADLSLECTDGVPVPAPVTAEDLCESSLPVSFVESVVPRGCPANRDLHREWVAADSSGNEARGEQVIAVRDTQGPVVVAGDSDLACFRAPSHALVELAASDFAPVVTDACSEVAGWVLVRCESDQPDDDLGDGHTAGDCSVSADGARLAIRGERDGRRPEGRRYGVVVAAVDVCGNWSAPARLGFVRVLHDLRDGGDGCRLVAQAAGGN